MRLSEACAKSIQGLAVLSSRESDAMPWSSFEHFETVFDFAVKAADVATAGLGYYFPAEIIHTIYRVVSRYASTNKCRLAQRGIQQAGDTRSTSIEGY